MNIETPKDIHALIEAGKPVYWVNKTYRVIVDVSSGSPFAEFSEIQRDSGRYALRVMHTETGMMDWLHHTDISGCFVGGAK